MTDEHDAVPTGPLEDVSYLSRSANRDRVLNALAEGPNTRREPAEQTGASRTTLDRIVNELEDRGWAERTADGDYVTTATGDRLTAQGRPFIDSVRALRRLDRRNRSRIAETGPARRRPRRTGRTEQRAAARFRP